MPQLVDNHQAETTDSQAVVPDGREIKLWINDREISVPADTANLLEAARLAGIDVPSLCYLKGISASGSCRICLVEVESGGRRTMQASCVYPVQEGIRFFTNTPRIRRARKRMLELLLSEHDLDCVNCVKNRNCELQKLADDLGVFEPGCGATNHCSALGGGNYDWFFGRG